MSYQVLARRWRPRHFDEVVGQKGVTQTLRNAIDSSRLAQSYVFAGPRGVGKTTTARILARCLNCVTGPTAAPCGTCDACVEIAEGRDMDVQEIDAATHTGIDSVREVIIDVLGQRPVRDRYKIYIIDEVHRFSKQAFDGLLKSIEEPPPHVVFMMATTELDKVPPTIQSRSQVFELKAIGTGAIRDQLKKIAIADKLEIDDMALALVARSAEGSMRDAQSALDQVIAFAGTTVTSADVAAVLGLVGRDLLYDMAEAVADENPAAIFAAADRAAEAGNDLKLVCRELARMVRDMLVVTLDPSRLSDPDIAPEPERDRLQALAARFSPEDLMRAFDVLSRAEFEVRGSAQPRYHLEMALLKLVHLRKLAPIGDLLASLASEGKGQRAAGQPRPAPPLAPARAAAPPARPAVQSQRAPGTGHKATVPAPVPAPTTPQAPAPGTPHAAPSTPPSPIAGDAKDAILSAVRTQKKMLYGTVIAQAQRVELTGDTMTFMFGPAHKLLRSQLDQQRAAVEAIATEAAGRRILVKTTEGQPSAGASGAAGEADRRKEELKKKALEQPGVQTLIDVFGADIQEVEEIDR
ncbi:MAG: DNA polymerase III subunit gamma/tau [Acidobacteriota bacterium]|nr:DNA polymerase III subunit gamma/tau [Acidobacteriota bacterium]